MVTFSHKSSESEVHGPPQISEVQLRAVVTELEAPNQAAILTSFDAKVRNASRLGSLHGRNRPQKTMKMRASGGMVLDVAERTALF